MNLLAFGIIAELVVAALMASFIGKRWVALWVAFIVSMLVMIVSPLRTAIPNLPIAASLLSWTLIRYGLWSLIRRTLEWHGVR